MSQIENLPNIVLRLLPEDFKVERLLELRESHTKVPNHMKLIDSLIDFLSSSETFVFHTSGSSGKPKKIIHLKSSMIASAKLSLNYLGIPQGSRFLICLPAEFVGGFMTAVRCLVNGGTLYVTSPKIKYLASLDFRDQYFSLISTVPTQLSALPQMVTWTKNLLIGAEPFRENNNLRNSKTRIIETYGMTETCSHVALRDISAGETNFTPLPGATVKVDHENRLILSVSWLNLLNFKTNDKAKIFKDGSFKILGRLDDVINCGGKKILPSTLREQIHQEFPDCNIIIKCKKDEFYGEAPIIIADSISQDWMEHMKSVAIKYNWDFPVFCSDKVPRNDAGKIPWIIPSEFQVSRLV